MAQTVVLKVVMSCQGCAGAVKRALEKMEGVESFDIDMKEHKVTVKGNVDPEAVFETVSKTGKKTSYWPVEAETEPKADAEAETKVEAKADAETETKVETKVEAKVDAKAEAETKVEAKADAETETKVEAKVDAKADAEPKVAEVETKTIVI